VESPIWLHGIPGCGKTVLSATVIDDVRQSIQKTSPAARLAFYYFVFNDSQKQSPDLMLRSVLFQLLEQSSRVPVTLASAIASQKTPTIGELLKMLRELLEDGSCQSYIVLDALDECTSQDELLEILEKIASWNINNLHLLLTSRPEPDIKYAMEAIVPSQMCICLQTELVNADIRKYVSQRLLEDRKLKKWKRDPKSQNQIETKLAEGAQGM
jgi:Cdc6-like AAA superfamily ATPase